MKPLGQKPHHTNFTDCHPPKGFVNWWEAEGCDENKAADKRNWKRDMQQELTEEHL